MIKLAVWGVGLVAVALAAWVRLAPSDPARWHVDPQLVSRPSSPNFHLLRMGDGDAMAPVFDRAPGALARALHEVATADGATLLAGRVEDGHMTYVARSRIMGFPDYISVRVSPAEGGAILSAFARARFGYSDMGVNRERLDRWVTALRG